MTMESTNKPASETQSANDFSDDGDVSELLSEISKSESSEYAMQVVEIYQQTMGVFRLTEAAYRSAIRASQGYNGYSSTTNQ
jgi:hypothetical protein